ncbi:hypothetical protein GGTG_10692 [Gaeumannomyces tritici R3-111a-1]|uniref:Uncharacterized protein n=1 Tax=Gaeumannomyces tritici (strain R3-111a-1) TaxID=644352 RepID=J3PB18_GAET3|nr:hypothetical protein GGTG_10692 [Gaeumannomyces tritici R3-111a-1]EJT71434.1 hypothetical protein GGTG_10692 [Gaeumannomyces tritici R3-111a-1]
MVAIKSLFATAVLLVTSVTADYTCPQVQSQRFGLNPRHVYTSGQATKVFTSEALPVWKGKPSTFVPPATGDPHSYGNSDNINFGPAGCNKNLFAYPIDPAGLPANAPNRGSDRVVFSVNWNRKAKKWDLKMCGVMRHAPNGRDFVNCP